MTKVKVINYQTEEEKIIQLEIIPRIGEAIFFNEEDIDYKKLLKVSMVFHQPFSLDAPIALVVNAPY